MRDAEVGAIDQRLQELAARKGALDEEIGRWLLEAKRADVPRRLGFASLAEYAERRLGFDPHTTKDRLRVAQELERLPRLRELLRMGARSYSAVREIVRVASPEHEEAWIAKTEGRTVREIEALVRGRAYGDAPETPKDPVLEPRRLVFELPPEDFALVTEAFEHLRREIGPAASNREALRAMAETIVGKRRPAEPAFSIALTICASCDRTWQHAGREAIEVPASVGACGLCDGELAGATRIDGTPPEMPAPEVRDSRVHVGRAADVAEPSTLVGRPANAANPPAPMASASEMPKSTLDAFMRAAASVFSGPRTSLTPLRRRFVDARDQGRCSVTGCPHHRFVQVHHLEPQAAGGSHDPDNTITLCDQHHRLFHEGCLAIEGTPATGLRFTHSGGTLYGRPIEARFDAR